MGTEGSPFLELGSLARDNAPRLDGLVAAAVEVVVNCVGSGGKVLACGNGGSAADAQHFVAELVGRLESDRDRAPLPAIALTCNPSVVTAVSNDYGFESVFARQVEALGSRGDVLVAITTSGASPNVVRAAEVAREKGMSVVALTGAAAETPLSDSAVFIPVPGRNVQRTQEIHIAALHALCDGVETFLTGETPTLPA
ncbi:MAG: D-sedoheptulose-7-phosphate isomerase [Planctomycetota bacterium]